MQTQTLEILKDNAIKAYNEGCTDVKKVLINLLGKETFIPKDIADSIKTFEDALKVLGIKYPSFTIDEDSGIANDITSLEAYIKLIIITRALNEGWVPDWKNSNQYKYYPWFNLSSGSGLSFFDYVFLFSGSGVGSRLCFKSSELAEYAGKQFTDIYKDFFLI